MSDLLTNHPLLQPSYISKVIDEVVLDTSEYRGMELMPQVLDENEKVVVDVRKIVGGMTMAVAPGAPGKIVERRGMHQMTFTPANFKEKVVLGERDIKTLRKLGTAAELESAADVIARSSNDLRNRAETRAEWLRWQAIMGTVTVAQNDVQFTVTYGIPASHTPTLLLTDRWSDLVNSDPLDDLLTWAMLYRSSGAELAGIWYNKQVQYYIMQNEKIRQLRESIFTGGAPQSRYVTPEVLKVLVKQYLGDIELNAYDKGPFFVGALTTACAASDTVVVDDATGLQAGAATIVHAAGDHQAREDVTILSISANTITLTGATTGTYPIGSSIRQRVPYIPDDRCILIGRLPSGTPGGSNWGEMRIVNSSYGPNGTLMEPRPGFFMEVQEHDKEDPKSVEVISGFNGLPVMYYTDVNVVATVT